MAVVKKGSVLDIDNALSEIGEFGKFQILLEVFFCFSMLPMTLQILLPYFSQDDPPWRCVSTMNNSLCNITGDIPATDQLRCNLSRSEWQYSMPKDYSIVTQFDLYCDTSIYPYIATSMFFVGWAVGGVLLGWLADRYGRFLVFLVSQIVIISSGLISAFSPNYAFYACMRALTGIFVPGVCVQVFVLASEFVGSKYRPLAGILLWAFFALALVMLGAKAYLIRKWKILSIVCTAPYTILLLFHKLVPESVRWLQVSGKTEKAIETLQRIARVNRKTFTVNQELLATEKEEKVNHANIIDIFRPWRMAVKTLVQGYSWLVEGMVYYGVSLAADDLGGSNRYVNYILSSLVDFPAVLIAILICNRFGRKKATALPLFVSSLLCIAVAFIPKKSSRKHLSMIRVATGLFGKLFAAVSFDSIYTWSVELYPTVVRGEGMGFLTVNSRIGAALAPWITKWMVVFHPYLPFLIMGGSSFIASIMLFWLPETRGKKTAETLDVKVRGQPHVENSSFPLLNERQHENEVQLT